MADKKETETKPPETDAKTGVAMAGKHPLNHRLRAESLAKHNANSDPDGMVSDELIADTKKRLERETKAEKAADGDASGKSGS